ncbi:MAG: murein biosynthesis integral membrane protein MurJ, partial [Chloroflexi bacterium]|nr:murein biosynthesis integral membrane protein MurJ [Chloroflexota bacterium]
QEPALLPMTVALMRVMLLSAVIFGVSGVMMGALNARQHFLLPAVAPIIYNLGIIAGAVLFAPNVMGLAIGTVSGALGHLAIQLPGLRRQQAHYTPVLSLRDPGVRQVLRLMAPRILGLSFGQLNHLVTQFLAQSMALGSIPALGLAWRVMIMPQGIIGQALGIASFPTFATLAARSELPEMRRILADTLRLILFFSLPASVLLVVLRQPIVTVLFERGQFGAESTGFVAWALLFYSASLVGLAATEVISRAFYALEDTLTPVVAGGLQLAAMIAGGLWLSNQLFPALGWLPLGGLALAYSLSALLEVAALLWWLRRKMGGIDGRRLLDGLWRMALASLLAAGATWLVQRRLANSPALVQLLAGTAAGGAAYLAGCLTLKVEEIRQLLAYSQRLLNR